MPVSFAQGKVIVARTIGGANDPDQLLAAGDAIQVAIQEWNIRDKFNFLLRDNSDNEIDVDASISTYALPANLREVYSVRLVSQKRALIYINQRDVDRIVRDQSATGTPSHYTLFRGSTDFAPDSLAEQQLMLKLIPTPNYTAVDELLVRYYRLIASPAVDADNLDVPDRYVYAFLTMAKYYFLVDKDAESARTEEHKQRAEYLFALVQRDDQEYQDEDLALTPQVDYGQAWGPDTWETSVLG